MFSSALIGGFRPKTLKSNYVTDIKFKKTKDYENTQNRLSTPKSTQTLLPILHDFLFKTI